MTADPTGSAFRFEKRRAAAVVTLVGGESVHGSFFTAAADTRHSDGERIGDLLNADTGFFPFELDAPPAPHTVLFNRAHVITVALFDDEAKRDAGYAVATSRTVSILLSNGQRVHGIVRVYRPEGRNRLSDWTRQPEVFRYVETGDATIIVNAAHIVAVTEAPAS
jgi:hypothetical protein